MEIYTNVVTWGDNVFLRGVDKDGNRFNKKIKDFRPYVWIPTSESNRDREDYRTISGEPVRKLCPGSIKETRKFIEDNSEIDNFCVYGDIQPQYQYIQRNYPDDMTWDSSKINVVYFDIETGKAPGGGFPTVEGAEGEILSVAIKSSLDGQMYFFGRKESKRKFENIIYVYCDTEEKLILKLLEFWTKDYPDIISGWNCIPTNSPIWGKNEIRNINEFNVGDVLLDSTIKTIFPKTQKPVWVITLMNGKTLTASGEHIFPYYEVPKGKYTKFSNNPKNCARYGEDSVKEISLKCKDGSSLFFELSLGENDNEDLTTISDDCLYCLGAIYTDGSISLKENVISFYNNNNEMIAFVKKFFDKQKKRFRKGNGGIWESKKKIGNKRVRSSITKYNELTHNLDYIFQEGKKNLNLNKLSKLSTRQFFIFMSGCIDGDGSISNNSIKFCNYNGDLEKFYELLLWNGVFSSINNNKKELRIFSCFNNILLKYLSSNHSEKKIKISALQHSLRKRDNSSNSIYFRVISDNKLVVKVLDIKKTENYEEMMDIETDSHYFWYSGVKTHNCNLYDVPYLINRTVMLMGERVAKKFSPWEILREREVFIFGRNQKCFTIMGVAVLDYMDLYKKFTYKVQESYTLDYVAEQELGVKKVDYSHIGSLHDLYEKDYDLFVEYNIQDTELIVKLEEKMGLIQQAITIAYDSKINFEDVYSEIRMWDVIIYDYLLKRNIVIPPRKENIAVNIPGGFVKQPTSGLYEWVASFDLTSLYPHLIMQYNISPDSITNKKLPLDLDKLVNKEESFDIDLETECIAANGQVFRKNKTGFLSELMAWMFKQRKVYKNKMLSAESELEKMKTDGASEAELFEKRKDISKYNNLQMAKKIGLNSAYGACASPYFRYFNPSIASGITLSGQLSIRWIERKMNEFINRIMKTEGVDYIITCDTDSIYINMGPVVKQFYKSKNESSVEDISNFVSKICREKLSEYIDKSYVELSKYMSCNENKMFMKLEAICDKAIFQAKKQYILRVVENEGVHYAQPKIKMKGIQAVKSSTPYSCRQKLKDALSVILSGNNEDVWRFIETFRKEFYAMKPQDVAFPRSVKGIKKYSSSSDVYTKGTPIHVRGSILYNHYLKKFDLEHKYVNIYEGDKIKFIYLKLPNPIRENIIAFPLSKLPEEFGLNEFIDYEKQFEKTFLSPLKLSLDAIKWSHKEIATLEQFFN